MFDDHLETRIIVGGEEQRIIPGTPIGDVAEAERRIGWPLPADYRDALTRHGTADVFGARLLHPSEWRARGEPLEDGRFANFLPFARRPIPDGGELLFCFRFELTLREMAAKNEEPFLGAAYAVVACHLLDGLAGARLEASQRPMAPTFSAWIDQLVAYLKAR